MKKVLCKIHLYLSIPVGLIISILCLTGAAMIFDSEIHKLSNPHLYDVEKTVNKPLPISQVVARLESQLPDTLSVTAATIFSDSDISYQFSVKGARGKQFFVNQYSGELLGEREKFKKGGFYRTMFYMHRWLMDGDREWGKLATGVSTLILVIILITGVIIWIPKNAKGLKEVLSISVTKGWRRFWYDLHVSGGIYITGWLLVLGLTGLMWSFSWYRSGVYSLFNVNPARVTIELPASSNPKAPIDFELWDKVCAEITSKQTDIQSIMFRAGEVRVYDSKYGNTRAYNSYYYNTENGNIEKVVPYSQRAESSRFMGWIYAIHVGSWGGITGKTLTFIVSLLGGILPITGYYLWIKRLIKKRKNKNRYK